MDEDQKMISMQLRMAIKRDDYIKPKPDPKKFGGTDQSHKGTSSSENSSTSRGSNSNIKK